MRTLFVVAALSELGGVALIVAGIRAARRKLDTPVEHIIHGGSPGDSHIYPPRASGNQSPDVFLLEAMERQRFAVALLVIGIVTGSAGNFLG